MPLATQASKISEALSAAVDAAVDLAKIHRWEDGRAHFADEGGGTLRVVGRSDDIITSSGYRISPFEVESALIEHEAVVESAVVAKPDEMRGEVVTAFIILAPGFEASDELAKDIQDFVKNLTAPYKYPRVIEFRDALPKTISGKIRRVELRDEAAGL